MAPWSGTDGSKVCPKWTNIILISRLRLGCMARTGVPLVSVPIVPIGLDKVFRMLYIVTTTGVATTGKALSDVVTERR